MKNLPFKAIDNRVVESDIPLSGPLTPICTCFSLELLSLIPKDAGLIPFPASGTIVYSPIISLNVVVVIFFLSFFAWKNENKRERKKSNRDINGTIQTLRKGQKGFNTTMRSGSEEPRIGT